MKPNCNGMTSCAVRNGIASAKFFGMSSPMSIDNRVANVTAMMVAIELNVVIGQPQGSINGKSMVTIAGSIMKPVSRVVSVMPNWALDR
ncbi:unannotated protein [freshwater metagenome]|uniref:Unannotated protein n=1 Tax=freshwater metagenome TaxID=449393 RepID=A0A6J6DRD2_9ZZZZ